MPLKLKPKLSDFGKATSPRKALTSLDANDKVCKVRYGEDKVTFKLTCSARDLGFCNAVKAEGLRVGDDLYAIDAEPDTKGPSAAVVAVIRQYQQLAFPPLVESPPLAPLEWVHERPDLLPDSDDDLPDLDNGFIGVT